MKQKVVKVLISLTLALALSVCVIACSNQDKDPISDPNPSANDNAPVYTGMTIVDHNAPNTALATTTTSGMLNLNSTTTLTQDAPLPDVYQDEDLVINITFNNPKNYEILSFTINETKYSSYMFEEGSTMSSILVKTNVGSEFGEKAYTISAVKYVEGEAIKDVIMKGDQTIKINVYGFEKTETIDQLTYNFYSNKTATLITVPTSLEEVIIPSFIGDYKVTAIEDNLFKGHYGCHTVVYFPEAIKITDTSQFVQGSESRVIYVLEVENSENLGTCLAQYNGIAPKNLIKFDDCYYIISEQGATLVKYVGSGDSTYTVPNSITVNGQAIKVVKVEESAFLSHVATKQLICEYIFSN